MKQFFIIFVGVVAGIFLGLLSNWYYDVLKLKGTFPDNPHPKRLIIVTVFFIPIIVVSIWSQIAFNTSEGVDLQTLIATISAIEKEKVYLAVTASAIETLQATAIINPEPTQTALDEESLDLKATREALSTQIAQMRAVLPTSTSTPTPLSVSPPNTPTPTSLSIANLTCDQKVEGKFSNLWNKYKRELGCPYQVRELGADSIYFIEQWFQGGHMFFFDSPPVHFVITKYGTVENGQSGTGTWQSFASDPWSGKDENFCNEGIGLEFPIYDNFNRVWCSEPGVREKLVSPKDIDSRLRARLYGSDNSQYVLAQGFDNGFILRDSDGVSNGLAYVFLNSGTYIRDYYK